MKFSKVIAIDGPSGSGKSTLAKKLSEALQVTYIDTGAMFRALAFYFHQEKINMDDSDQIKSALDQLNLEYGGEDYLIKINGRDLTKEIREHFVSELASKLSVIQDVRTFLLEFQRRLAQDLVCVMEGRDVGSVVFPNALVKFYVTASLEVRAERRRDQLEKTGSSIDLEELKRDVLERDERDSKRSVAPLVQASGAWLIDTSYRNIDDLIDQMADMVIDSFAKENITLQRK